MKEMRDIEIIRKRSRLKDMREREGEREREKGRISRESNN